MAHVNKKTLFLISLAVLAVTLSFVVAEQANAISVGNTVQFTANTNVRSCASTGCGIITTAPSGSTATVVGGPQNANGYQWWNVRLSSGTTGWAVSNWMTVVSGPAPTPTVSVSVNPSSITAGQSTTFSWLSTNASYCTGSLGGSYGISGSFSETLYSTKTYGMNCTGSGGSSGFKYATVTVSAPTPVPTVSVSVNPTSINLGESVTFSWSSTNATSCTGSRGGSYAISGSNIYTPPSLPYTYGMSCTGPGGTSPMQSATVSQKAVAPPVVSITLSVSSITVGQSATLGWGTSNATSCNGSASLSDSNWSGSITPVGDGSKTVRPVQTTTYTLSCSGPGGSASNSVTITVTPPAGQVPLNVPCGSNGPINKVSGQSVELCWGIANVTSWSITGPGFSRSGGSIGATPQYDRGTFTPPSPASGTSGVNHVYTIIGTGSEVRDSVLVMVRNQQCRDGSDNDGDGSIDYPGDPGCSSSTDDDETDAGAPQCSDGSDNDGDGRTDYPSDPGCSSSSDNDEFDAPVPAPQCRDGADNDGDSLTDYLADPGCSSTEDNDETNAAAPVVNLFRPIIPALDPVISIFEAVVGGPGACTIDAAPKLLVMPRNTSTLTWSCDRVISGCTLHDDNPKVPDMGAVSSSGSRVIPPIDATTVFTLQCPSVNDASVTVRLFDPYLKEIIPQ